MNGITIKLISSVGIDGQLMRRGTLLEVTEAEAKNLLYRGKAVLATESDLTGAGQSLRTDGPTLEEYIAAGYTAEGYPPAGYAAVASKPAAQDQAPTEIAKPEPVEQTRPAAHQNGKGKGKSGS